ncbi:MAG: MBL fold metallo-hydrolase [Gammaproteobacteria bacterium]|jgi:glyoxylase-like metal-dependent hydrolase (beta-lactamase superfamily II)
MRFSLFLLLACLSAAVVAADYPPVSVEVTARQVSEHVYYTPGMPGTATDFEGFVSNAAFVVTDAGVVVFDALGSPSLAWELRRRIREITDQPVVKVVLSHYHADHVYGLQVFQDEGAEIIAPVGALEYLDSPEAAERLEERRFSLDPWVNERTRLVRPDRLIDKTYRFELGGVAFRLDYLGKAHADGDLSMFVEPDAVLLAGDIIFEGRVPWVGDADTRRWLEALAMMEAADLKALIPGHGPAAAHPKQALAQTREYVAYLREVMGAAVDQMQDFASAYEAADWSRFENLPAFDAANRRNAYQVYLALERESMAP